MKMFTAEHPPRGTLLSSWFITGFAEGEGGFTCSRNGKSFSVYFSIRQRQDYADLVDEVRRFFGVGKVYRCQARGKTQASCYYRVSRWNELPVIVAHFRQYPLQSLRKQKAFEAWASLIRARGWRGSGGSLDQMEAAAQTLSRLNTRPRLRARAT